MTTAGRYSRLSPRPSDSQRRHCTLNSSFIHSGVGWSVFNGTCSDQIKNLKALIDTYKHWEFHKNYANQSPLANLWAKFEIFTVWRAVFPYSPRLRFEFTTWLCARYKYTYYYYYIISARINVKFGTKFGKFHTPNFTFIEPFLDQWVNAIPADRPAGKRTHEPTNEPILLTV